MKKSEKYRIAIVAVLDAYKSGIANEIGVSDVVETLAELCDTYSTAKWQEEHGEEVCKA